MADASSAELVGWVVAGAATLGTATAAFVASYRRARARSETIPAPPTVESLSGRVDEHGRRLDALERETRGFLRELARLPPSSPPPPPEDDPRPSRRRP